MHSPASFLTLFRCLLVPRTDARDAMTKAVYGRLFGWIVNKVNHLLAPEQVIDPSLLSEIGKQEEVDPKLLSEIGKHEETDPKLLSEIGSATGNRPQSAV